MRAFVVATVSLKDIDAFAEYGRKAGATMAPFGGSVLRRGRFVSALAGSAGQDIVAVIEFPDREALESWYASSEYQAIIPLRDQAADVVFTAYEALG